MNRNFLNILLIDYFIYLTEVAITEGVQLPAHITNKFTRNISLPNFTFFVSLQKSKNEDSAEYDQGRCQDEGGDLAIINSEIKQAAAMYLLLNFTEHYALECTLSFGLLRQGNEFFWRDNTSLTEPTYWARGEPNLAPENDCVIMKRGDCRLQYNPGNQNYWMVRPCKQTERIPLCEQSGSFRPIQLPKEISTILLERIPTRPTKVQMKTSEIATATTIATTTAPAKPAETTTATVLEISTISVSDTIVATDINKPQPAQVTTNESQAVISLRSWMIAAFIILALAFIALYIIFRKRFQKGEDRDLRATIVSLSTDVVQDDVDRVSFGEAGVLEI